MGKGTPVKVFIAGGGTGGHFFSGVAVGEACLARASGNEVIYVGTRNGIEARVGPREGLDVRFIDVQGIKGKGFVAKIIALLCVPRAILQSIALLLREKPNLVIGVGGYASGPMVLAAWMLRKRTGIVEQNSVAGVTNRILGRFVERVFVAFKHAAGSFPASKVRMTGNPIREDFVNLLTLDSTVTVGLGDRLKLLVVGGSQGAHPINEAMIDFVPHISEGLKERLYVIHQTGVADEERVRAAYEAGGIESEVMSFIDEMAEAYRSADLVLCRAGALTVSELCISRRGSVLVPFPQAADNHQEVNAQELVEAGAGQMLLQRDLSGEKLAEILEGLYKDRRRIQEMAWRAATLARPEAASEVIDEMYRLAGIP